MIQKTCTKTGQLFTVSDEEMALRRKFGIESEPDTSPAYRFMLLGAFWQHWHLYERTCDKTGKDIISVFSKDCPYPVWHRDEWIKYADPPGADFDTNKDVFPQMWEFFKHSPIAHNMVGGNENCEYTDDWWYCKNCYLCHSGLENQDLKYCYRTLKCRDSQFLVFSTGCELSVDLTYCFNCFQVIYAFMCHQCHDSAFLFDCRNCQHCLFCSNLRNREYCILNQQYTKEEYERKKLELDLRKHSVYEHAQKIFWDMMKQKAWFRANIIDHCENSDGNFLSDCKNCHNCYLITGPAEDCINSTRQGGGIKDSLDCVGAAIGSELAYSCCLAQDTCYDNRFCYNTIQCRFAKYCAHCIQCEYIFGCCGLVGKKYYIFNRPYTKEQYEQQVSIIVEKMKQTGEYGQFFPGYFAAHPYNESWAYMHWPMDEEKQKQLGLRLSPHQEERVSHYKNETDVPDDCSQASESVVQDVFWDIKAHKPFQIQKTDISFCQETGVPLPYTHYARRLQENFKWIPFSGMMRNIRCPKCKIETQTDWPSEYNNRILCESCYQKEVY